MKGIKLRRMLGMALLTATVVTAIPVMAFAEQTEQTGQTEQVGENTGEEESSTPSQETVITGPAVVITAGKAKLLSVTSADEKLKLKWKASGRVTGYVIYRKTSGTEYKKIKTIRDKDQLTYTDKHVTPLKTYRYKIVCFYKEDGKIYYGANSNPISCKVGIKVGTIKAFEVKAVKISLQLKWKKKGNVTGYFIYKKEKKGEYKRIAKVTEKKYLDEKVFLNKKYAYKVRPYLKKDGRVFFGEYTKGVSGKADVKAVKRKITDKNSGLYGKTVLTYEYNDGTMVSDPEKYLDKKDVSYVMYINKSRQMVTAYAQVDKCLVPVKVFICSPGNATPLGTFHLNLKYRWHELMGPCWGQYCSRITTDGVYFHSIFSSKPNDNKTMSVSAYNKLGTTCSHGCVRLQAYAAKWIYENCPIGTTVVIYNGSGYEPFKKPVIGKVPYWHTWDPTDDTAKYLCKEHKCH